MLIRGKQELHEIKVQNTGDGNDFRSWQSLGERPKELGKWVAGVYFNDTLMLHIVN